MARVSDSDRPVGTEGAVLETIERFAEEVLAPSAAEIDEREAFAAQHLPALREVGLLGLNLPEEWGGAGISATTLYRSIEALAAACASTTSLLTAHYLATDTILMAGSDEQRRRFLPRIAAGKALCAFALTEPQAGSNPADMRTIATADQDSYRIRGVKHFISNAAAADIIVVFAKTDAAAGARGVSAFVLDRAGTSGVTVGPAERTMGLRGGHVFEVGLDCEVSSANRLGDERSGFKFAMRALDNGRIDVAAQATGIAGRAIELSVDWLKSRKVAGEPIARFQGLQWMLADMATELSAARALGLEAARRRDGGKGFSLEASMAKLFATEVASRIADNAIQIHGGYGYTRGLPLERFLRDLRIFRIYEGSSEIQRNIIARHAGRREPIEVPARSLHFSRPRLHTCPSSPAEKRARTEETSGAT
ncbi:MAG: acyl-CoA dehydrogenase family protein [Hyphomicrobiaceae bacterium]